MKRAGSPQFVRRCAVLARRLQRRLPIVGERGATSLEWTLLLAAIALPSYFIVRLGLAMLFAHYRLVTTMNGLPFP